MNNLVDVQVSGDKIVIKMLNKDIVTEFDNIACFDSKTQKLINVGINEEKFREDYPKQWNKHKQQLVFQPVFDEMHFKPEAAGMLLWGWLNEMAKHGAFGNIILRSQTNLEINIAFQDYLGISSLLRSEFEYLVFYSLHARKLLVNDKEIIVDKHSRLPRWSLIILNFSCLMIFLFLSVIPAVFLTTKFPFSDSRPFLSFVFYVVGILGSTLALIYLGNIVSIIFWILCMKPFVSREIIAKVLKYEFNLPLVRRLDKLTKIITNQLVFGSN